MSDDMWLYWPIMTLAFAIGIAVAPFLGGIGVEVLGVAAVVVMLLLLISSWWSRLFWGPVVSLCVAAVLFFTLGVLRMQIAGRETYPEVMEGEGSFELEVLSGCRPAKEECSVTARLVRMKKPGGLWEPYRLRVRVYLNGLKRLPLYGDRLLVRGRLGGYERGLHRFAFDARSWSVSEGLDARLMVDEEIAWVDWGSAGSGGSFSTLYVLVRREIDYMRARFERVILTEVGATAEAGVLLAMTTGTKALLSDEYRRDFAAAGIAHVLAVSGMHLGLIVMVFYFGLWRMVARVPLLVRRYPAQQVASVVTMGGIITYVVFTGFPISAVRAGLMAIGVLAPRAAGGSSSGVHSLTCTALAMLMWNPRWLASLGFQLSLLATLSLILLRIPRLRSGGDSIWRRVWAWGWNGVYGSVVVSTVTAVATFPPLLWAFGTIPASSQLGNLLCVPPLALVALPATFLGVLLQLLVGDDLGVLVCAGQVVEYVYAGIQWGGEWFCAEVVWGQPSVVGMVGWVWLGCISPWLFRLGVRRLFLVLLPAVVFLMADLPPTVAREPFVEFHAIPVGQGDSTLVVFPHGTTMLIDAGGSGFRENRTGEHLVLPYLRGLGYGRVDIIVSSHGDADHMGGLIPLMRRLAPSHVFVGTPDPKRHLEALFYKRALEVGAKYHELDRECRRIFIDDLSVDIYPRADMTDPNNRGLVFRVCMDEVCGLFVGDIEQPREEALLQVGADLRAQYLKVGHHGSSTSTSRRFLDAVAPSVAIFHMGANNRFGFPHAPIVDRLQRRGIVMERTDRGHAIVHETDGVRLWRMGVGVPWVRGHPLMWLD